MTVEFKSNSGFYRPGFPESKDSFILYGRIWNSPENKSEAELVRELAKSPEKLNSLEADMALAFYRAEDDSLILIRDACGQTPLFYSHYQGGVAFAFSLPELFQITGEPPINEETFYDFTATHYRHVFRDPARSFHQGVFQVPAGSFAVIKGDSLKVKQWFKLQYQPEASRMSFEEASRCYVNILDENVRLRVKGLTGDYGFTVSSGMDSATVACLAAPHVNGPVKAWFMAYKEQSGSPYDESKGVEALIRATGWQLNRLDLNAPDLLSETRKLLQLTGAPIITVTWLAHYVLARKASQSGLKYLFSGLGGDETLAGEFEHFFLFFADLKASGQTELLERETKAWIRLHDHPVFKKNPEVRDAWFERNIDFKTRAIKVDRLRYEANRKYFSQDWVRAMEERISPVPMPTPFPYFLSNRLIQEMTYETSPPTIWSEAMSSRAGGIRGIFPMTSPRLINLALSLPGTFKYEDGVTKMILRRSLSGILPDSSRLNPVKTGFNAPLDAWLRDKNLANEVLDLLTSGPFSKLGWLAPGAAEIVVREHLSGTNNHMMLLWPLITTALFLSPDRNASTRLSVDK